MKTPEMAREVLRRAIELRVLDTADVELAGSLLQDPRELVENLAREGLLSPRVKHALTKLVELRPLSLVQDPEATTTKEELLDLTVLDQGDRRAIEAAAFARIALELELTTPDRLKELADDPKVMLEDRLLADGVIDAEKAMEIFALRQETRSACGSCFGLFPPDHDTRKPCPSCGQAWTMATHRSTRDTLAEGGKGNQSIDGFPGQGGLFAGYELVERLAEGGMGVVFKARQTKLNRLVALKVMRGGSLASKDRRRRFLMEAEAAAALRHPSIVPVHEIDEVAGYPFYTMDLVDGITLDRYVIEKKLEPKAICALMRQVSDAVHHFHLRGIIHRDLKPGNILVGEDGVPKIIDFGIAKKLDFDSDSSTIEGEILGTPHYMAPEQAAGRVHEVDVRTDVYAIGAILYELLTGAPPWKGLPQAKLIWAIQDEEPDPVRRKNPTVEPDLELIVSKSMAKERERRYQSAHELLQDLENYEKNLPISARPATFGYRLKKAIRRRLPAVVASGVIALVLAGLAAQQYALAWRRRDRIRSLLARSQEPERTEPERDELLREVLAIEPENLAARSQLDLVAEKRRAREEEARRKQERLEADLARERADRELKVAQEREQARLEAEQANRQRGEERARAILAEVENDAENGDPFASVASLNEALAVLPAGPGELRTKVEARKFSVALRLAKDAVLANEPGLAKFWLRDLSGLATQAAARRADLDALRAELERQLSGERDLEEARALARAGDWVAARAKLRQAREQGITPARLEKDRALIEGQCAERAQALLNDANALLAARDATGALARARDALRYGSSEAARALVADCEARIANDARREAAELFARDETRARALAVLDQAERIVEDAKQKASLRRERRARAKLLEDPSLAGLVFVPEVPELGVKACYVERTEVTNAAFKPFVDAQGYERPDWWDESARALLPTFKDGCPGATCTHRAPRTWVERGYGEAANADRPVRGVTVHEARAFARWRSKTRGGTWRLPTDAEWEVAAGWDPTAARLRAFTWGDGFVAGAILVGADLPGPVGTSAADVSPLGVVDACGNVMEWVERAGGQPGTKGAAFPSSEAAARHFATIRSTGSPGASAPPELLGWIGFRLAREIDE